MAIPGTTHATAPPAPRAKPRLATIGDIVQLRSGSTSMCVTAVRRDGSCACVWFDEKRYIVRRAAFPAKALWVLPEEAAET
jgi:uncharacterized protein YodC (DUF2158 family)